MADDWTTIGDIAEVFDGPHATPKKIDRGSYFLSISSLDQGKLDLSKSAHISEEQYEKWTKRVTPQEGDVLFSYETRLGEAALMPGGIKACLGRRMGLLRPNRELVDPSYLLFAYLGPDFQREIVARTNSGATVDRIALKELPSFPIRIPQLQEQREVASVLSALDKKIQLNRQINTTLESMAQALFKSWFVDFDPVIDNALAAGNPIPEPLQARAEKRAALLAAASESDTRSASASDNAHPTQPASHTQPGTAAPAPPLQPLPADLRVLFPDSFVFNEEMGWVPEGWAVKQLAEFTEVISKGTTPSKTMIAGVADENVVPFIKVKDIDDIGDIGRDGLDYIPESVHSGPLKRSRLKEHDVLFSIAGTIGRVSIVSSDLDGSNCNQAVAFIRPKESGRASYISLLLRSNYVQDLVDSRVVQAVQANFSLTELSQIPVLGVGEKVHEAWLWQMAQWRSRSDVSRASSRSLIKIRDLLLPKLLSGQIQISAAEKVAEGTQ